LKGPCVPVVPERHAAALPLLVVGLANAIRRG
jgi:hypothetical protein